MCFSASVSFVSSGLLAVTGAVGTVFSLRGNKRFLALNMMSFFYVIQQFSEGMIWVRSPVLTPNIWGMVFLFFAFFVYPWYQSFACFWITRDEKRKNIIRWLGYAALIFGVLLYLSVLMTPDLGVDQCRLHIFYDVLVFGQYPIESTFAAYLILSLYLLFTVAPFFISDARYTSIIGWVVFISAVFSWIVYTHYFISVWCFYSAIISLCIAYYSYFEWGRRKYKLAKQLRG